MTARVRKQPERGGGRNRSAGKRQAAEPGLLQRSILALGAFAARHPSVVGGGATFAVVFSFVAANALWYQPGGHPSPIMKTRSASTYGATESGSSLIAASSLAPSAARLVPSSAAMPSIVRTTRR